MICRHWCLLSPLQFLQNRGAELVKDCYMTAFRKTDSFVIRREKPKVFFLCICRIPWKSVCTAGVVFFLSFPGVDGTAALYECCPYGNSLLVFVTLQMESPTCPLFLTSLTVEGQGGAAATCLQGTEMKKVEPIAQSFHSSSRLDLKSRQNRKQWWFCLLLIKTFVSIFLAFRLKLWNISAVWMKLLAMSKKAIIIRLKESACDAVVMATFPQMPSWHGSTWFVCFHKSRHPVPGTFLFTSAEC